MTYDAMPAASEKDFQRAITDLAKACGWKIYHTYDSRRSNPGWPDLVLAKPPRLLFVEVKTDFGKLRPEQQEWLQALLECQQDARVWRPRDWFSIERTLTGM